VDPFLLSLVSACTALVASIAGPLVTLRVARRQFGASVLSANRQKWVETLRDLLAELISSLVGVAVIRASWKGPWDQGRAPLADPTLLPKLERVVLVQWKIRLLTNPAEADHRELVELIDAALKRLRADQADDAAIESDIERITRLAQSILKREWERVKRGE